MMNEFAQGSFGPAGLRPSVAAKINADSAKILKTPDFQEVFARQAATPLAASPEEFGKSLGKDIEKWASS
jgi:tripartite-type tricarboxylate transporter receptor subunit TctC